MHLGVQIVIARLFNSKQCVGDGRNPPSPDEKEVPMHTMTDRKIKNRVIKKNSSARKIAREEKEALKIVPEARKTEGELQASGVKKLAEDRMFVFDRLAVSIAERKAMPDAILNYSKFKRLDVDQVLPQQVKDSSAGVHGWASASIESWENESPTGPKRSGIDWPPATEDDRHGERDNTKTIENPPESKSQLIKLYAAEIESRSREHRWQEQRRSEGKDPVGSYSVHKIPEVDREAWQEVENDRREARRENERVRMLNCFLSGQGADMSGGPPCGAWQQDDRGWTRVS